MTGVVLWSSSPHVDTQAVQLEFAYLKYDQVINAKGKYDWTAVDSLLKAAAKRKHQMVIRFWFTYPDKQTAVPAYIKSLPDYQETFAKGDGKPTWYPDWSHDQLQQFTLDFYSAFAKRYDQDPRLAFLQTGFGLWAEYHCFGGPLKPGQTFPSKAFQKTFYKHMNRCFKQTPWMMSVNCIDTRQSPVGDEPELIKIGFGLFDDSLLCKEHDRVNAMNWKKLGGKEHAKLGPHGGEFSYYNQNDQQYALAKNGPNGTSIEQMVGQYGVSFVIGNDQPRYQKMARIEQAGLAMGYRFKITRYQTNHQVVRLRIKNVGVAPIYYEAFPALGETQSQTSLKGLMPGKERDFTIPARPGHQTSLSIQCDRLVPGQTIAYEANLE